MGSPKGTMLPATDQCLSGCLFSNTLIFKTWKLFIMNKGVIVLLAVCLVSVHAMVKRDAPAAAPADGNNLAALEKQFKDFTASIGKQLQSINGEEIQKSINDAINNLKKTVNDLTKPTEAKQ